MLKIYKLTISSILSLCLAIQPIVAVAQIHPAIQPPSLVFLKGLKIYPQDPLRLDFILDETGSSADEKQSQQEYVRLAKYFLTALTIPDGDLWVNLSPKEPDRIIALSLGQTDMGRDLLQQDYVLKQLTASLMNPDNAEGRQFWDRVYQAAYEHFGTTEIPMETFHRVWIVPAKAVVYRSSDAAFVVDSHLKVLLEEEYSGQQAEVQVSAETTSLTTKALKDFLLPLIETEVNEGAMFAPLRRIYEILILAKWYKTTVGGNALGTGYVDRRKIAGIEGEDPEARKKIYENYLTIFSKGSAGVIQEAYDPVAQQIVQRQYFSGGIQPVVDEAMMQQADMGALSNKVFKSFSIRLQPVDSAMMEPANVLKAKYKSYFVWPDEIKKLPTKDEVGDKGVGLIRMWRNFRLKSYIPPFFVIPSQFFKENSDVNFDLLAEVTMEAWQKRYKRPFMVAVRAAGREIMPGILETKQKVGEQDIRDALISVHASMFSYVARDFRREFEVEEITGAIIVQQMVFGDKDEHSASGAAYTRNPQTGENIMEGVYRIKTTGEATMTGSRVAGRQMKRQLKNDFPSLRPEFDAVKDQLEREFKHPQEFEFVIESGRLYLTQSRDAEMNPASALRAMSDMYKLSLIGIETYTVWRKNRNKIKVNINIIKENVSFQALTHAESLSMGAAKGILVFSRDEAIQKRSEGFQVILVSETEDNPEVKRAVFRREIDGLITLYGDFNMHEARLARQRLIPAVAMPTDFKIVNRKTVSIAGREFAATEPFVIGGYKGLIGVGVVQEDQNIFDTKQIEEEDLARDMDEIAFQKEAADTFRNYSLEDLMSLHAIIKGNIWLLEKHDQRSLGVIELDYALNAIHKELINKKAEAAGIEVRDMTRKLLQLTDHYQSSEVPRELLVMNWKDLKSRARAILRQSAKHYQGIVPTKIDYLNYPPGRTTSVNILDELIPVEFSLAVDGISDLSDENAELMIHNWGGKFFVHYEYAYSMELKGQEWRSLELENVHVRPDPLNPNLMRVHGDLNMKKVKAPWQNQKRDELTFTVHMKDKLEREVWLDLHGAQNPQIEIKRIPQHYEEFVNFYIKELEATGGDQEMLAEDEIFQHLKNQVSQRMRGFGLDEFDLQDRMGSIRAREAVEGRYIWLWTETHLRGYWLGEQPPAIDYSVESLFDQTLQNVFYQLVKKAYPDLELTIKDEVVETSWTNYTHEYFSTFRRKWISVNEEFLRRLAADYFEAQRSIKTDQIVKKERGVVTGFDLNLMVTAVLLHKAKNDSAMLKSYGGIDLNDIDMDFQGETVQTFSADPPTARFSSAQGFTPQVISSGQIKLFDFLNLTGR